MPIDPENHEGSSGPPRILEYGIAECDQRREVPDLGVFVGILVAFTVFVVGAVWAAFNMSLTSSGLFRGPLNWEIPGAAAVVAAVAWASLLRVSQHSPGILLGALIGLGVGLCAVGVCFVAIG